ncbi:MAG: NAD(+)/NADH kinase [Planctomycetaceae bacterium]|nr:NAD(+)/NADH kinase [Planctomycetaceae bacterium]
MSHAPWVAIQRNPRSGSGKRRRAILDLCRRLRELGLRPRVFTRREKLRAVLDNPDRRASLKCVVAAGGDGTLNDVINRCPDVPVAMLPLGTENLLARHLKIERCGRRLAETIAAGQTRRFDVATLNGRRFLLVASVGVDADVIHRLDARRTGNISHWTYIPVMTDAFRRFHFPPLRIFVDDAATPLTGSLVVIANLPEYAFHLPIAASACGDDGLLDVRVFERPRMGALLRYCYHVIRRQHETLADVHAVRARRIRIESDTPVPIQIDGDPAGWTPAEIVVLPGALEVIVPSNAIAK